MIPRNFVLVELTQTLTLFLPMTRWLCHITDLHSESNIVKMLTVNVAIRGSFLKEYSISFLTVPRLINFAAVVPKLLRLNFHWNFNPFSPCDPLCCSHYQLTYEPQYLQNNKKKHYK